MTLSSKSAAYKMTTGAISHILENKRVKSSRQLERHTKGISNHRRIEIVILLAKQKGITLDQISGSLDCNFKTVSGHTNKLAQAGLIEKKYIGKNVLHALSPLGKKFYQFLQSF